MVLFFGILIKVGIAVEIITAIIGTCYYYKYKQVPILKYIVYLLWYTVLNELIGHVKDNNSIIYNIYHVINFTYFLSLYRCFLKNKAKTTVSILILTYFVCLFANSFYENYLTSYQSIPYSVAAVSLIVAIILYFIEILNSKLVLYTDKILLFWISVGLLLYFVGTMPFRIILNYYTAINDVTVYFLLNFALTIIMNLFFIIGFVWSNDKQKW